MKSSKKIIVCTIMNMLVAKSTQARTFCATPAVVLFSTYDFIKKITLETELGQTITFHCPLANGLAKFGNPIWGFLRKRVQEINSAH
jgi:hypothetical protein